MILNEYHNHVHIQRIGIVTIDYHTNTSSSSHSSPSQLLSPPCSGGGGGKDCCPEKVSHFKTEENNSLGETTPEITELEMFKLFRARGNYCNIHIFPRG